MTLEQMQLDSKKRLEALLGAWTEPPTSATRVLLAEYKQAYLKITKRIEKAYVDYLTGVNPDNYETELLKFKRLQKLQAAVTKDYIEASRAAAKIQYSMGEAGMTNSYYQNMYSVNWFTKDQYFLALDQKALQVSVYGTPEIWESIKQSNRAKYKPYLPQYGTLSSILESNAQKDLVKIQQSITQGIRQGKPYAQVARDLREILNTTGNNAVRIARTEGNRNLNAGAFANSQAAVEAGIDLERMYLAILDSRTRQQSGSMDGQTVPANKPFHYQGLEWYIPGNSGNPAYDINDRCTAIDKVGGQNPALRRAKNPVTGQTEVVDFTSFDDWTTTNGLSYNKSGKLV